MTKRNHMFPLYMTRLACRVLIFLFVLYLYIWHKDIVESVTGYRFFSHFTPLHVLWAILMAGMLIHILPVRITMSGFKSRAAIYREPEKPYDKLELYQYTQAMNVRAWYVALVWLGFNAIPGILYLCRVIGDAELILLSFFYYTSDLICMMLFCPFQKYLMGNRCCVNCRIFDWGHMMMYTPMLFIRSFYSWSLLFTSLAVMLRWEIIYAQHPERFWRGSNAAIRCENCRDKTCRIKKPLVTGIDFIASKIPIAKSIITINAEDLDKH